MKRITLSILGLALVLLAGCVVTSVYPYYTAKDLTFDPALLGTWSDPAETNTDRETWTFEKLEAQTYKLVIRDTNKTNEFDAHLFTMGGAKFLDALPRDRHEYTTPNHVLLHVKALQPQLELRVLSYDWLVKLIEANPKAIRHVVVPKGSREVDEGGEHILTADTTALQKFIRKHLKNDDAWGDPMVMKKQ